MSREECQRKLEKRDIWVPCILKKKSTSTNNFQRHFYMLQIKSNNLILGFT